MPNRNRGTWVGIVGPDGAGKTALVEELLVRMEADGLNVAHTHGRPQAVARRTPPAHADPSKPHAAKSRGLVLSMAKYLLAVLDFMVARRRLLSRYDVWLCERPLLDYEVDPTRYQLDERLLPVIRRLNALVPGPDDLLLLSGDAQVMADRKGELDAGEIDRQLSIWRRVSGRVEMRTHTLDTTGGGSAPEVAEAAAAAIRNPARFRWRVAPVKPTRLDVRYAGSDIAALDVYRPIRLVARAADSIGRTLTTMGLTPRTASPDPAVDALVSDLREDGWPVTGVSAMASSGPNRWIVGLADRGRLTHVLKVGPRNDECLQREAASLRSIQDEAQFDRIYVPTTTPVSINNRTVVALSAVRGELSPVTQPGEAITAATELAEGGWTHGDLAPWNLFLDDDGRLILLDWESAKPTLRPLWDIVHYLSRLGATTHPAEARAAFADLISAGPASKRLLTVSGVGHSRPDILDHVDAYLSSSEVRPMSQSESKLRAWMQDRLKTQSGSLA